MSRVHLASLVEDFLHQGAQTAVVVHRGNRRFSTSYSELGQLAGRFAAELHHREITPGERVVIWGQNGPEWIAAFFGCLLRGALAVPLDAAGSPEFAVRVIAETAPRLIVGDGLLLRALVSTGADSDDAPPAGNLAPQTVTRAQTLSFAAFAGTLPATPHFAVDPSISSDTPMQIVFTSGTTSAPKGIVHTHRNVLASLGTIEQEIARYRRYERLVHPLRFLHTLPLSHVFGQFMGLWVPPLLGAEVHFTTQLEPVHLLATIRRERISVLAAVPRVLEILRAYLLVLLPELAGGPAQAGSLAGAAGLPVWKRWWRFRRVHRLLGLKFWAFVCGGATVPTELERFWGTLGLALVQGYGLTETAALVTLNHPFRTARGSIGKPMPGREVRLGEGGEIEVRGEMLSTATWEGGRLEPRVGEWLSTGDLAAQDESGALRFVGRKGDVIVTSAGMNIYPADLERALGEQPGVRGSAVVACPPGLLISDSAAAADEPVAVLLFAGSDEELASAVLAANRQLAPYQQMRRWLRWPSLAFPWTSTGKLLRREISAWACRELAGQSASASPNAAERDTLLALIESVTGERLSGRFDEATRDDARLSEDLRLDSLGRVQLQAAMEQQLGLQLDDEVLAKLETLGQLRALAARGVDPEAHRETMPGASASALPAVERSPAALRADENASATTAMGASGLGSANPVVGKSAGASRPEEQHHYPGWPQALLVRWLRTAFIEAVLRPLVAWLAAPRVVIDPSALGSGPYLLIANHVTAYDAALVLYALPRELRDHVAVAMSGELLLDLRKGRGQGSWLRNALAPVGYVLITALFNVYPLPRLGGFRRSFAHAGEMLDLGNSVMVFPEGRRSPDGVQLPFRAGIGLLAQQSQVSLLPVALHGLGPLKAAGKGWFRSGQLVVHVGAPVPFDEACDPAVFARELEEILRRL